MRRIAAATIVALVLAWSAPAAAQPKPASYARSNEARAFIREMVERHGFVEAELEYMFGRTQRLAQVLQLIVPTRDAQGRSWRVYRERFVNERRIAEGIDFWQRHAATLERAAREHGVPAEIIVAIIGVETLYGRQAGTFRVVDALATLAFDYPPRAAFFRSELEQYLLYAREADIDVFSIRGSYAGAIGMPQFMPGSYRRYAVDFDGDGVIDLRASAADAIGSVANFLRQHGWRPGEPIQAPASVTGAGHQAMIDAGIEPSIALSRLREYGVETRSSLPLETPVALIDLATPGAATEYRLGLRNFYVLTRYNRSSYYAASVHDLAQELRLRR